MLGKWMATLRKTRGWTQEQLAELAGVPRSTIAKWETGGMPGSGDALEKVARALDLDPLHLAREWPARKTIAAFPVAT
ncbi:unnamed protein product, partial [Phaeothamnion confervicola]